MDMEEEAVLHNIIRSQCYKKAVSRKTAMCNHVCKSADGND